MKSILLTLTLLLALSIGQESIAQTGMLPDSVERFSRMASGDYDTVPRTTIYAYDLDGNRAEEIRKDQFGRFIAKNVFIYFMGRVTETHTLDWVVGQGWVLGHKEFVYYDENGIDTSAFDYYYPSPGDSIISEAWRTSNVYDSYGRVTTTMYLGHEDSSWLPLEKADFFYNGNDTLPNEAIAGMFDHDANQWVNTVRLIKAKWDLGFTRDYRKMQPSVALVEYWENGGWVKGMYDSMAVSNGKISEEYRFYYNEDVELYELLFSMHNAYDNLGARVMSLEMKYGIGTADTERFVLDTFSYGSSNEIRWHSHFAESISSSTPFGFKEVYHYGSSSLSAHAIQGLALFPNPVVSGQYVQADIPDLQAVVLYNSQGQELRYWDHFPEKGFSTEGLPPGLYFLKASGTSTHYVGRLVVR